MRTRGARAREGAQRKRRIEGKGQNLCVCEAPTECELGVQTGLTLRTCVLRAAPPPTLAGTGGQRTGCWALGGTAHPAPHGGLFSS